MNDQIKLYIKRGGIVLCIVLAIVLIVGKNTHQKVKYATSYNRTVAFDYEKASRLYKDPAIQQVKGNSLVRVAILLRDYEEGYDELRSTSTNLSYQDIAKQQQRINADATDTSDVEELDELRDQNQLAFQELNHQVLATEATYFRELGAKDLQQNDNTMTVICTMRKKALSNLEYGLCNYTVILCPKETSNINDRKIESYVGEYTLKELAGVPLHSDTEASKDTKATGKLTIQKESISLEVNDFTAANCTYAKIDTDTMNSRLLLQDYPADNPIPVRLLYSTKQCYEININENLTGYLFITESGIYVDLGDMGLYRF